MRFSAIHSVMLAWLCCFPLVTQAQTVAKMQMVDSLILHFKWRTADTILDELLENDLSDAEEAKVLMYKARVHEKADRLDKATAFGLKALEKASELNLPDVVAGTHITLSLIQENIGEYQRSSEHLDEAEQLLFDNRLERQYAHYYVRRSSLMRVSSKNPDSLAIAMELAELANQYATKYKQPWHLADSYLLLSALTYKSNINTSMAHRHAAIRIFMHEEDYISAGYMYTGMANVYCFLDSMELAFAYYDSGATVHLLEKDLPYGFYALKADLFRRVGEYDSAFANLKKEQIAYQSHLEEQKRVEVAELNAVSEAEKKQAALESQLELNERQKRLLVQATAFSIIAFIVLVIVFVLYRKLKARNQQIDQQAKELETALQKQQVLLAEVQHRVKNNLQVIIGLLDLQLDAAEGKSIEEVTRESQRRIESMAFLHDKIYLSDELDKVNLQSYLDDIAKLMESSYSTIDFPVKIEVSSDISSLSIDKAIPLGLITVELLINSFKHAFREGQEAHIQILTKVLSEGSYSSKFIYSDNGKGFEGELKGNGLGMEIIRGLVGQLHGIVSFEGSNGYEATILF
ncbi:MAG: hypothetical protein H6602_02160 [Flavobacteriales bacterium]|nr:hypothetical protein [Flavobacteriales bacterium]